MSFLNVRVTPEPPSSNPAFETELNDSFGQEKEKDNYNNNEGKETSIIDDRGTEECHEGFDGIPEEQLYNASSLLQNVKPSRPGSQSTKLLSWNIEDAPPQISKPRYHACDRVILVALCLLCAASVVLTLLMLFGVVGSVNCACTKKTGIYKTRTLKSIYVVVKIAYVLSCCALRLINSRSKRQENFILACRYTYSGSRSIETEEIFYDDNIPIITFRG